MTTSNIKLTFAAFVLFVLFKFEATAQPRRRAVPNSSAIFPKGERVPDSTFTGIAWVKQLITTDSAFNIPIANVTFEPGARTYWHSHAGGQVLLAIAGIGYYQEKGKPIQILRKGDVVKCPANLPHWHGASLKVGFTQVAITPNTAKGRTTWFQEVTDEEYTNLNKFRRRN